MTPKFTWQDCPNPCCRILHCRERFQNQMSDYGCDGEDIKLPQRRLVIHIQNIEGVESIYCNPYRLQIIKAELFGWQEICPQIEAAFLEYCRESETVS